MAFFSRRREAERYAQSRPYFHPLAIDRAISALGIQEGIALAIDVGCGTGQSSVALVQVAESVIGIDISQSMLAHAERSPQVNYAQARAEVMPFRSNTFPLMTTALAFHWFDREHFLKEAWRVIRDKGWLVVYNNWFSGIMRGNRAFNDWGKEVYLKRYPTPPRDSQPLTPVQARESGFSFIGEDTFENKVVFTPDELVAYLMTQSNVTAAVAEGSETLVATQKWLTDQLRPYFGGAKGTFVFRTRAWYLRKRLAR